MLLSPLSTVHDFCEFALNLNELGCRDGMIRITDHLSTRIADTHIDTCIDGGTSPT